MRRLLLLKEEEKQEKVGSAPGAVPPTANKRCHVNTPSVQRMGVQGWVAPEPPWQEGDREGKKRPEGSRPHLHPFLLHSQCQCPATLEPLNP